MSLIASSDLITEVSSAADPGREIAVMNKLKSLSAQSADMPNLPENFTSTLDKTVNTAQQKYDPASNRPIMSAGTSPPSSLKAQKQLESVLLSQFIGEMMPKDTHSVFGEGYAGDMWRSMLSERIADQIASSGNIGISKRLFQNHDLIQNYNLEKNIPKTQTQQKIDKNFRSI